MTLKNLISPENRRKILKEKLESKNFVRGIEVHNAISALIANDLKVELNKEKGVYREFDFFWESSLTDSASKGHPDIEIVSFDSRLRTISEILEVTNKPIIVDGDTGGDIHHFEYLIPRMEKIGISAIIIEDKIFPKRNSLEDGAIQNLEDPEKFAEKIAAGKKIQRSGDFMIIARLESLIASKSIGDALARAKIYIEAGADGIMIHSKSQNPDDVLKFAAEYEKMCSEMGLKKPLVCVPTTYSHLYESELEKNGFNIVIYANHFLRAAYKAMEEVGKTILENGRALEVEPKLTPIRDIFKIVGFLDIKQKDEESSAVPSVIIPAAGKENIELKHILNGTPKPLLKINNKSILDYQVELFEKVGLNDINIVIGYGEDKFPKIKNVNYIQNKHYLEKGVLYSLMMAKDKMKRGFICAYSDIIFDERLLRELLERKEDFIIVVDNNYTYHQHEINKKLDAVITKKGTKPSYQRLRQMNDEALFIGNNIPKNKMTHEYIGLTKVSKKGAEELIRIYEDCLRNHEGQFHESPSFEKAGDTDMMQELINRGLTVSVHETNGGWIEIHNERDISAARDILSKFEPI